MVLVVVVWVVRGRFEDEVVLPSRLLLERREACARWQRRDFDCDDGERSVKKCARKIQRCEPLDLKFSSGKTNIAQQSEVNRQLLTPANFSALN